MNLNVPGNTRHAPEITPPLTLTKREHFAAVALQGIAAIDVHPAAAAAQAVEMADALIAALSK